MSHDREGAVTDAFVSIATSLADGDDMVELLDRLTTDCARLLDVDSAALLLADRRGILHIMAASSEDTRNLEIFQLQRDEGPCLDCYRTGAPVNVPDLREATGRWPQFAAAAAELGIRSAHATPMRLRGARLGSLGLFGADAGGLSDDDLRLAQALTYVAGVAIVQDKAAADSALVNAQLQTALDSRVVLEQAKGVLAQVGTLAMDEAFAVLRDYARDHNLRLTEVAKAVVTRQLPALLLIDHAAARAARPARSPAEPSGTAEPRR